MNDMDGEDFITVARELANKSTEAHWRSAISRAYYGAFHVAKDALAKGGIHIPTGPSAHGDVRRKLINSANEDVSNAGSILADMHSSRIKCDYKLQLRSIDRIDQNSAAINVRSAKIITECIKKHLKKRL